MYRFMGITEQLSWLAQFAGQGYEDISALASLIMLQEMMLGEEYLMIAGSSANLAAPARRRSRPDRGVERDHGRGERHVRRQGHGDELLRGDDRFERCGDRRHHAGQVVDVTIVPVVGAMNYNIYVSTATTYYLAATGVGGTKFTLQGTPPAAAPPPAADTGTGESDPYRGRHSDPVRPVGERGRVPDHADELAGRLLQQRRRHPPVLQRDLHGAEEPVAVDQHNPGAFRADPAEMIC